MFGFCMHLTFQVADAGLFLRGRLIFFVGLIAAVVFFAAPAFAQNQPAPMEPIESFITSHCIDCHAGTDAEAGFDLESLSFDIDQFSKGSLDTTVWEKTLRRVDAREMPPASADRPKEADYQKFAVALNRILDDHSKRHPVVGRVGAVRRLTRPEPSTKMPFVTYWGSRSTRRIFYPKTNRVTVLTTSRWKSCHRQA